MKPGQLLQVAFVVLAAFAVYGFVATVRDGEKRRVCAPMCAMRPNYAAQNRRAPDFELPALSGGKRRLSDYRGKVVILNFWTKTCAPCLEEMPSLAELSKKLSAHPDVEVVTISTDESLEDARATLQSILDAPAPFAVLLDPESEVVSGKFGTKLYPETWLIDPAGVIRARFDGPRDWSDPITIDLAESLSDPQACPVEFVSGRPRGPGSELCEDYSPAS